MGEDYASPQEVRDPLFKKLKEKITGLTTYNCTLEDVASMTANFHNSTAYLFEYDHPIENLTRIEYRENNTLWSNYSRANPLDELNIHGFFNNATQNWDDKLSKMGNKTQVGCYFQIGYLVELVCAFT